jgi:hypothetical protein
MANFNESDHPRADDGKFTSGSGSLMDGKGENGNESASGDLTMKKETTPGYRTMTSAQRHNARQDKIWEKMQGTGNLAEPKTPIMDDNTLKLYNEARASGDYTTSASLLSHAIGEARKRDAEMTPDNLEVGATYTHKVNSAVGHEEFEYTGKTIRTNMGDPGSGNYKTLYAFKRSGGGGTEWFDENEMKGMSLSSNEFAALRRYQNDASEMGAEKAMEKARAEHKGGGG